LILKKTALAGIIGFLLITAGLAGAQTFSGGQITGVIKDSTGAVLPGVSVAATNVGTNLVRTVITNESGVYAMPALPLGTYQVAAELPGFQKQTRTDVKLEVGDNLRIDFNLVVGQVTENVMVTSEVPAIQAESASLGTVIDNRNVLEMPLNGRNFTALVGLVPGAVTVASSSSLATRGGVNFAGARDTDNSYTLDGVDNGSAGTNGPSMLVSVETLQEFKVVTNSYSPEYGRGSGGQVIMSTRSGTNEYRGTVWEFARNSRLFDAKNLFDPPDCSTVAPGAKCGPIPPLRKNQFGAVFGGPVPKVNNLFFFLAYEGLRSETSYPSIVTVPIAAFHQGDFSSLLPKTVIKDPKTGIPFPNNVIPQQNMDPIGAALLNLYPLPTSAGVASNLLSNSLTVLNEDQATLRMDYHIGKHTIYVRHLYDRTDNRYPCTARGGTVCTPGFGWDDPILGNIFTAGATLVFSPNLIGNARIGINHIHEYNVNGHFIPFNQQVGLCCTDTNPYFWGRPSVSATGYQAAGDGGLGGREDWMPEANYTQSIIAGNHNLSAGFSAKYMHVNTILAGSRRGTFSFDGTWSGNPIADMLLGYPRTTTFTPSTANLLAKQRGQQYAGFFNDDWKVNSRLTLNLGVRYELTLPQYAADDAIASFDFATGLVGVPNLSKLPARDPVTGLIGGVIPASLVEQSPYGRGLKKGATADQFNPRVGFAYSFNPRTVVRGGYGVFRQYLTIGNQETQFSQFSPWFPTKTYQTDSTTGPVINLSNSPFPDKVFTAPLLQVSGWDPNFRDGYNQNWNLSIQRELVKDLTLETAYLGNKGTKLFNSFNYNQSFLPGGPLGSGSQQSRKRFPNFSTVTLVNDEANSNFEALQFKLERRFSGGLSLLGSYLWGKALVTEPTQDTLGMEKALASFDARQHVSANFIYQLPLGEGHRFINSGPLTYVLGGWQTSSIIILQSGRPQTPTLSGDPSNTGATVRPNLIGDPNTGAKTAGAFWNPNAFALPAAGTFGNAGGNTLIGPGMRSIDFSMMKNFSMGADAKRRAQFRLEMFNVFNHPIWAPPTATVNVSAFNTVTGTLVNTTSRQIQLALKIFF
jgi:hypothetical protein